MSAIRTFSFIREVMSVYEMLLMYLNWRGGSRPAFDKGHKRFKIGRSVKLMTLNRQDACVSYKTAIQNISKHTHTRIFN